ncbi:hypothetical protein I5677_06170 [Mobilitalea sibirica]|uniref:Uncharacterized protein n=1 Tax=Mobilitalea sibirica TaxID=1462919 RepID=A0A8J7H1T5_9FIRM|nr:hypothetical protein [Mobilitalea sibirica]MBH1940483.1 hypothetical protein [Mobilitalea sibirica]
MCIGGKDNYNQDAVYPFDSYMDDLKDSGCYYLPPEICKDIIITSGVSGVQTPLAIKKIRKKLNKEGAIEEDIPVFRIINRDVLSAYAGVLAESLVAAAEIGKGVEIIIGYPKALVIKVS